MTTNPNAWAGVLNSTGALGLALIVLVVLLAATFAASVTLITLLIRHILQDERIPKAVWVEVCQRIAALEDGVDKLAEAVKETTVTLRVWFSKSGGA